MLFSTLLSSSPRTVYPTSLLSAPRSSISFSGSPLQVRKRSVHCKSPKRNNIYLKQPSKRERKKKERSRTSNATQRKPALFLFAELKDFLSQVFPPSSDSKIKVLVASPSENDHSPAVYDYAPYANLDGLWQRSAKMRGLQGGRTYVVGVAADGGAGARRSSSCMETC